MPPPRPNKITPMSERQQMALLIQMTATEAPRAHVKKNDHKKGDADVDESNSNDKQPEGQDIREKSTTEEINTENRNLYADPTSSIQSSSSSATTIKRSFSDIEEDEYEDCSDDLKKKKRKDSDNSKDTKPVSNLRIPPRIDKTTKQAPASKSSPISSKATTSNAMEKEQTEVNKTFENETETDGSDDMKSTDNLFNGGLKVPPLKIVIPQQNCSIDTEGNVLRTGKITTSRNAALPYVVSSSNESNEKETPNVQCSSPHESSPLKSSICTNIIDEKNMKLLNEEKNLQRVLRSSHRSGVTSVERSSNNSSPQMQSSSPSPASSSNANETTDSKISYSNNLTTSPMQPSQNYEQETIVNLPSPSTSSTSSSKDVNTSSSVDLHPRKRKIRTKNENETNVKTASASTSATTSVAANTNAADSSTSAAQTGDGHPHDFPFTNGFQMYLNIRRQIEKKWKNLYPVKPRPPQGYNEYLLTKRSYLLNGNQEKVEVNIPNTISEKMRDIYLLQEKERNDLMQRHTVEREKLCLNVEQEMIRVHSKAARNISCQSAPYSVCTLLKDDEVYNMMTPEQDEKDKNARHRFNGRLLSSWLQDVDDKWEKVKESMVLRHHNEAESLHAVQLMDWEIALKRSNLCDYNFQSNVEKDQVPIVHVSDDFYLLP